MKNIRHSFSFSYLKYILSFIFFLSFLFSSCEVITTKDMTEIEKIQAAFETFRSDVSITISEVAKKFNMEIEEKSFVFVSPDVTYTSPIVLAKGLDKLSTEDFISGRNILLSFFNLPEKSQIKSGFYIVKINKSADLNRWNFSLIDTNKSEVFNNTPSFREGQFNVQNNLANRFISYVGNEIRVHFGFTTKNHSSLCSFQLNSGTPVDDQSKDGQKIITSLKSLRREVESIFTSSTIEKLSKQILIITRDDKTALVSVFEKPKINADNSVNILFLYLKCRKIPAGFYSITIKNIKENYSAYLLNEKKEIVSELKINVDFNWKGDDMGVIGGISDNDIHLSFINEIAPEQKAAFNIIIND